MKNNLTTSNKVVLSIGSIIVFFISMIGIGSYFYGIEMQTIGNLLMLLLPLPVFYVVTIYGKKTKGKLHEFKFKKLIGTSLIGTGIAISVMAVAALFSNVYFGTPAGIGGLKNNFEMPFLILLTILIVVIFGKSSDIKPLSNH